MMTLKFCQPRSRRLIAVALITTGTLLPLFGVGAATASLLPGGVGSDWQDWVGQQLDPLAQIWGKLQRDRPILEKMMEVALGEAWKDLKTAPSTDSGPPNPYEVRTTEESTGAGVLTTNPVIRQRDFANLYDQETARSIAAPMLGQEGEQWMKTEAQQTAQRIESSQQGVAQVQQLAQEAQGLSVTQDVMKHQAQMNSAIAALMDQQTQLSADNHTALMQVQRLQGVLAQLAANTSEGIDEANRRDRVERQVQITGSTQAPIYIPGLLGTDPPSRTADRD